MATLIERDLTDALRRLRIARSKGDHKDAQVFERRLDWLLDCLIHQQSQKIGLSKRD